MKTWKLANFYLRNIAKPLGLICLLLGPVQFLLILLVSRMHYAARQGIFPRLEDLYLYCYCVLPLLAALAAGPLLVFGFCRQQYGRTKGIYTLLSLPGGSAPLFWGQLAAALSSIYCVIAAQLVWYAAMYQPVLLTVRYWQTVFGSHAPAHAGDGLFLAFTRNIFLRLIAPLAPINMVSLLLILFGLTACLLALAGQRGIKLIGQFALLGICCVCALTWCVAHRTCTELTQPLFGGVATFCPFLYLTPPICLVLGGFACWSGIHRLARRSDL